MVIPVLIRFPLLVRQTLIPALLKLALLGLSTGSTGHYGEVVTH